MDKITHERDKDGRVRISAEGELYNYEAILSLEEDINGNVHLSQSSIDTDGMENSTQIKEIILETVKKERGKNGESPLIVHKD